VLLSGVESTAWLKNAKLISEGKLYIEIMIVDDNKTRR